MKEAVVVIKESKDSEKYISAYVVSDKNLQELDLKGHLKETLPEYMIPTYLVELEKMPLTTNGKLDRRALPEPNLDVTLTEYEAPRNEIEKILAKIWSEILGIEKISINDNFFEIGGHSLKATMLMSKIHKHLNKEVPLKELFKSPTIKDLSNYIENAEENLYSKIEKVEEKEYYEASSAQKRMYMLQQFDKNSVAYNMPAVFELEGKVDKSRIEETFRKLAQRHEALRTCFETLNGEIIQKLQNIYVFKLEYRNENRNIEDIISKFIRPFNLENAPLFRVELVENKDKTYLLIDMHHIISDGLSIGILINEFAEIYGGKTLEPLKLQYKDFAVWQNSFLNSEEMKKQEEYWINRFSDEIPVLNIPTDYERPAMQSFEGDSVNFEVDEDTTLKLRRLTKETGTTMHMALLSAFNILLSKYSGQEDIIIGTPIAGRPHVDLQNIIGVFVNTLALRNNPEGNKKYVDFLKEVKENSLKAYENQSCQFEALVEKLDVRRDTSRNPLFSAMFNMVDTITSGHIKLDDIILKPYNSGSKISKFDLTLNALERDAKINFSIEYGSKLFKKETIERLSSHYIRVLESIVNNIEIKLSEIDLISKAERNQILYEFNNTNVDYPKDKTIHELFEAQVEKTPNNIAVVFEDKKLTYRELNESANSLARVLRDKGVKADSIVGIMVERSLEMIVGIMGILKAGGAYLPIDTNYPKERIEYMLKDSKSRVLLSKNELVETIKFDGEFIDLFNEELFKHGPTNLDKINTSSNLAYIIYTSGTTGKPKGVMIEHRSLSNYVEYAKNSYFIEKELYMPLYTSVSFDLTVTSVFVPVISGNSIIIYNETEVDKLTNSVFSGENQSIIKLTPAHLSLLKEMKIINKSIKRFIVGGEDLTEKLARHISKLFEGNIEIINEYGPTEATVGCIVHKYSYKNNYRSSVLIGKPINNTKIYIFDFNNKLSPVGVAGEIYISGDVLARGYLNRPELTAEKFVDCPFELGAKMYKTGDLARWLPDGNIEFLGRVDNQVKIRGFRIELGEIESRLLQYKSIKEAVVVVKEKKEKEKYICAYIVSEKSLDELELKGYLKETLPEYMVPTYFVELEKMPLTTNGKIDRRALPEPNLDATLTEYEAPRNEVEETLVKIWGEVFGIQNIGINDNFFELGGHSLKATILMSKIHKELNKEISLKELFKVPTIKNLSRIIDDLQENPYSMIKTIEEAEFYETSSAQKRMYIINQFDKDSVAYNMPAVLKLEGDIDKIKIEETFNKLIRRHDSLRTYFQTYNNEIIQKIIKKYNFKLLVKNEDGNLDKIIKNFIKLFDLGKAPLFRAEAFENKGQSYLIMDMHHIISDGVSMNILIREFETLYNGGQLSPLKLQYKDFAAWQNKFLESQEIKKQEEYWINNFKDQIPVLNLKCDYERPNVKHFEGNTIRREVEESLTEKLKNIAIETGSTMHMVLLSAFNILLYKYSGQEDIIVGTPIAGRPHADIQNIMGIFVNTLALRNKPKGDKKYIDFLFEVKENSLKAYENQSYQLETLVEKLGIRRDASRNPLFDVMFNMIDSDNEGKIRLGESLAKNYDIGNNASKVDLTLRFMEKPKNILLVLDFSISLYNVDTIEMMIDDYIYILQTITKDRYARIDNIIFGSISSRTNTDVELSRLEEDFCL
ncbi:amino acid adenylation domain-containing protein [Clostridium sp. UBA5119]|uniref:amino acid adenylation domain-containing protein n=1 Tax=Clostridium sp. UBA5119 TaxID=1946366 RepID=UPI00321639D3